MNFSGLPASSSLNEQKVSISAIGMTFCNMVFSPIIANMLLSMIANFGLPVGFSPIG